MEWPLLMSDGIYVGELGIRVGKGILNKPVFSHGPFKKFTLSEKGNLW